MTEDFIPVPPRIGCKKDSKEYEDYLSRVQSFNDYQKNREEGTFFYAFKNFLKSFKVFFE